LPADRSIFRNFHGTGSIKRSNSITPFQCLNGGNRIGCGKGTLQTYFQRFLEAIAFSTIIALCSALAEFQFSVLLDGHYFFSTSTGTRKPRVAASDCCL
jgi:hypothetical protein